MRALFLLRADSDRLVGGTAEQLRQYARAVTERGGEAVLHGRAGRPPGRFARACADRVVLSPVHHDRAWELAYHSRGRDGLSGRVASRLGLDAFLGVRGA